MKIKGFPKGLPKYRYSLAKRIGTKAYLNNAISGMKDNIDNPSMFTKKFGAFYPRIVNVWFQFINKTYGDNLYIALPLIKKKDKAFYNYLEKLYAYDTEPKERIVIAEKLVEHIFKANN